MLKLPVNTELAKVRGVVGFNLPKWLTSIDLKDREKSVVFEIKDSETGQVDVTLDTSTNADAVKLTLGDGSLAAYIKALKLGKMLRYEYVPDFQSALYVPKPLGTLVKLD